MEELLANADPESLELYTRITGALILGGLIVAFILWRHHRRHPPHRPTLTLQLAERAWSSGQVATLLGSLFLLYFLASFSGLWFYEDQIPMAQLGITVLIYAILMVLATIINRRRGGSWQASYGMGFRQMKHLRLAPLFYLAVIPFLMFATHGYHFLLQQFFDFELELQDAAQVVIGEWSWLELLYTAVAIFVAPLFEELIFRGILFPYFVKRVGVAGGTALVSLVFAAMHFHVPSVVPLYLLSSALCLAYWRTGSLWPSIGIHILFNTVTILALNVIG